MPKKAEAKTAPKKKKEYLLEAMFNDEAFSVETDNVDEALVALKPDLLLTEVYVKLTKGEAVCERRLSLNEARRVFSNEANREVLVSNLLIVNG